MSSAPAAPSDSSIGVCHSHRANAVPRGVTATSIMAFGLLLRSSWRAAFASSISR